MPGPAPKKQAVRQRRNKRSTNATLPAESSPRQRAPSLPDLGEGQGWHALTVRWWRDIWRSPMAGEYLRADEHALFRLATLVDAFWREPSTKLAAEIRIEQQAFGLTPLDRRRLEWSIEREDEERTVVETRAVTRPVEQPASKGVPVPAVPAELDPRMVLVETG